MAASMQGRPASTVKDDTGHLFGAFDLQALRPVIRDVGDAQVSIEVSDEFIA